MESKKQPRQLNLSMKQFAHMQPFVVYAKPTSDYHLVINKFCSISENLVNVQKNEVINYANTFWNGIKGDKTRISEYINQTIEKPDKPLQQTSVSLQIVYKKEDLNSDLKATPTKTEIDMKRKRDEISKYEINLILRNIMIY